MSIETEIDTLLKRFAPPVAEMGRKLIDVVRDIRPDFSVRVSFAWHTVNFHHPRRSS